MVILRRGAHHRRTPDVNVLHDQRRVCPARHGVGERIEVDDNQVKRLNPERIQLFHVGVVSSVGEDASVDRRVQRFNASVERFGKPRDLADFHDVDSRVSNGCARRAG